jgi:hypothetical protein
VSTPGGAIAGSDAAQRAGDAYAKVRGADDIQYAPIAIPKNPPLDRTPPELPEWLKAIGRFFEGIGNFLQSIFEPIGKLIGFSWPMMQWVLIAVGAAMLLFLLYRLLTPLLGWRRKMPEEVELDWEPGREQAIALLDEADRLAAAGHYEAATHLLLQRSVAHIASARPGLLPPASTAREIALHPGLPDRARQAFGAISTRVERSLFALRNLDLGDWQVARAAYADFALQRLDGARLDEGAVG